jgi:hypothetical protein
VSYTSLPTRGPADLQAAITDTRAPAANELSADSIEAIKDRLIEIGTALGIDAGTTSGSVRRGYLPTLLQLAGAITPAQIVAAQNDYAPTGHADASVWRLDAATPEQNITGIQGGASGRILILDNIGSFPINLKGESGSSSAANRIEPGPDTDYTIRPGTALALRYDATASRWRAVSASALATSVYSGLMAASEKTKLAGIETAADVTDSANVAAAGAVMDGDFTVNGRMVRSSAGTYNTIVDGENKTAPPAVTDDSGDGYSIGSLWFDTTNDRVYILIDASVGAAVWIVVNGPRVPGVISGTTYTVLASDHGQTYQCSNVAGCDVTVPDTLPPGTTVAFYGTQDVVTFNNTSAVAFHASAFDPETAEAFSVAVIHVSDDPTQYILSGDLAPA